MHSQHTLYSHSKTLAHAITPCVQGECIIIGRNERARTRKSVASGAMIAKWHRLAEGREMQIALRFRFCRLMRRRFMLDRILYILDGRELGDRDELDRVGLWLLCFCMSAQTFK